MVRATDNRQRRAADRPDVGDYGLQFRALLEALIVSPGRGKLTLLVSGLVVVIGATTVGQVWLNAWNKPFFDAIEGKDVDAFFEQLLVFAAIAGSLLFLNVVQAWLDQTSKVELRQWLTRDLLAEWMVPTRAFLIAGAGQFGINPDQRIHDDARRLSELSVALSIGLFQSCLLLMSFIGVLWVLSESFTVAISGRAIHIPGFMVWCALAYAASGSWLTWRVGRQLVELGEARYTREADFRFALVRVSEASDGIALCGGERDEYQRLGRELDKVTAVMRQFVAQLVRLTWVTAGYGWFAIVAPVLIAAPGYFAGDLTFGELMMTVGAFNQVQQGLRWFVDNASNIAEWRAALLRVMLFRHALSNVDKPDGSRSTIGITTNSDRLVFDHVVVNAGSRQVSLENEIVEIQPGERALIVGKPGTGKSAFFRAIAGLWPWGKGHMSVPPRAKTIFLPQRCYVGPGSLREVLAYPVPASRFADPDLIQALERTNLHHLVPSLDRAIRWDKELTLHEQQQLSFARLLVHKPEWVISDETISHLNEENREIMFSLFERELAKTAVVSITSNEVQHRFYPRVVRLISRPVEKDRPTVVPAR